MQDWHALGSCAPVVARVLDRFLPPGEQAEALHNPEGGAKLVEHLATLANEQRVADAADRDRRAFLDDLEGSPVRAPESPELCLSSSSSWRSSPPSLAASSGCSLPTLALLCGRCRTGLDVCHHFLSPRHDPWLSLAHLQNRLHPLEPFPQNRLRPSSSRLRTRHERPVVRQRSRRRRLPVAQATMVVPTQIVQYYSADQRPARRAVCHSDARRDALGSIDCRQGRFLPVVPTTILTRSRNLAEHVEGQAMMA